MKLFSTSLLVIFVMLLVPGSAVHELASWLSWLSVPLEAPGSAWQHLDKLEHLLFFAVLAFTGYRAWGRRAQPWLLLGLLTFAVLTEWLQGFVPGRSTSWLDLLANTSGIGVGTWLGMLVWRERSRAR